ncbi:hypothetical protein THAOC_16397, partial [Thalassiosira oceanica]
TLPNQPAGAGARRTERIAAMSHELQAQLLNPGVWSPDWPRLAQT